VPIDALTASDFARVALANVAREYPRRLDQLLLSPHDEWRPHQRHPAFYGSYDWHSAVHMHWLLAHLLRLFPRMEADIAPVFDQHLSHGAIDGELQSFQGPGGSTFERPYGWAWLLALQAELLRLGRWSVAPLADELARRLGRYLDSSPYPVRAGTHGNTAFACVLALDYAHAAQDSILRGRIAAAATRWYGADRDYPVAYEPSADEFLSPALVEALLMRRVLGESEFGRWWKHFLPKGFGPVATPPKVIDHADPKHSHLDGLCLSRAWCFTQLGYPELAASHVAAAMPHVAGGDYAGEHWLASFAALALSAEALRTP
jgi:hypothetical protein